MKNYNKDNPPINCKCGCEATEKKNIVRDKNIGEVEYALHCKSCGEYLGTFEYGKWSY